MKAVKRLPLSDQRKILAYLGCHAYIGRSPFFSAENSQRMDFEGLDFWVEPITEQPALPYFVFRAIKSTSIDDKIRAFSSPSFDPLETVIMEKDPPPLDENADSGHGTMTVISKGQSMSRYSLTLNQKAIFVIPGNFAAGWQAWIDGQQTEVFEANLFSKGIFVPPGSHEVVLRYLPRHFFWGLSLSVFTIITIAIAMIIVVSYRRKLQKISEKVER